MSLFAMADLHLSTTTDKPMDIFGSRWQSYMEKIEARWRAVVSEEDTVVVPGDISWGLSLEEAIGDLIFLDSLPGHKIIGKGNHDFWWSTVTKMKNAFEENGIRSIDFLFNNAYNAEEYTVCGTRGWYVEEKLQATKFDTDYDKIVAREVSRLRTSLEAGRKIADGRELLAFFHFPPVFRGFICREIVDALHEYGVKNCYFGHIHGLYNIPRSIEFEGISMSMISADFLDFTPMIVMPLDY
ncbi:MAG: metallophosphoesterase [Clostridia bacterium]|nr:metallophosphoesterase [Clostridia bacterium]